MLEYSVKPLLVSWLLTSHMAGPRGRVWGKPPKDGVVKGVETVRRGELGSLVQLMYYSLCPRYPSLLLPRFCVGDGWDFTLRALSAKVQRRHWGCGWLCPPTGPRGWRTSCQEEEAELILSVTGDDVIKVGCQKVNLKMVFDMHLGD